MMPASRTAFRRRWLAVLVSTVVGLLVVEVALRTVGGVFDDNFTQPDRDRGWSLRPGFVGWVTGDEARTIRINSDGLRDREHTREVPVGAVRVAILGDSYMQAMNVPFEQSFPAYLERDLNGCAGNGRHAEVLNFGVSGYGTAQELRTFQTLASKFHPAIVVLAFYTNNDVYNNSRALNPNDYPEQSPYFVLEEGHLVPDDTFRVVLAANAEQPWWRDLRIEATDRLRVAQLLYNTWARVRPHVVGPSAAAPERATRDAFGDLEAQLYQPPRLRETQEAWRVTEALLLALDREVKAAGATLWVMTLSNAVQVHPVMAERAASKTRLGVDTLFYPDDRIREFAEGHGIHVITLAPAMADYAAAKGVYLNGGRHTGDAPGEGHWNDVANEIAAATASARLCAQLPQ